jgi:hypothetical protein
MSSARIELIVVASFNTASGELYAGLASHAGRRHEQLIRAVLTRRGGQRQALD